MKDKKDIRAGLTTTTTTTRTYSETETLTREEERVVRMVHGLSEPPEHVLEFDRSSDDEVNARLRLIEAALLAEMHGEGPLAGEANQGSVKDKILKHLRDLEEK